MISARGGGSRPASRLQPILLPEPSPTRVFLLESARRSEADRARPYRDRDDLRPLGAFRHEGGRYGPGDFDLGDDIVHHEPHIEEGEDCVSLVAMQGGLRWQGLIGRLIQPFVRL